MNKLIHGDALTKLKELESESIDCCVTSPPYWALRDYKVDGQLGLEPTIDEYVTKLVNIFDQVKRVLRKTGSCWVVIGDTYLSAPTGANTPWGGNYIDNKTGKNLSESLSLKIRLEVSKLKKNMDRGNVPTKSLCMIPERFAISMIDHGWILRNKIIWYKPNCIPSSAKDRFTVDWEYVYFFTKNQKYFFETQYESHSRPWSMEKDFPGWKNGTAKYKQLQNRETNFINPMNPLGRIKRCVWKISTKPFSGAHFAVFPPDLVEPMIKAGCPECGIVLDPFFGAGTVGLIAIQQNKDFIGIDINPEYIEMTKKRLDPFLLQTRLVTTAEIKKDLLLLRK